MNQEAAAILARQLMADCGLEGWSFRFDRAKRRAGCCNYSRKQISLSGSLTQQYSAWQVKQVILHEIAHALVGKAHNHDSHWADQVRALGGDPQRLVDQSHPQLKGPWVGTCPSGHQVDRWRVPARPLSCAKCSRKFSPQLLFTWKYQGKTPGCLGAPNLPASYRRELAKLKN